MPFLLLYLDLIPFKATINLEKALSTSSCIICQRICVRCEHFRAVISAVPDPQVKCRIRSDPLPKICCYSVGFLHCADGFLCHAAAF